MVGEWLNTKKINDENAIKPCHRLGWCPYGPLVEEFRLREERNKFSCETSNSKKKKGSDEDLIDVEIEGLEDYVGKGDLDMDF